MHASNLQQKVQIIDTQQKDIYIYIFFGKVNRKI